VASCISHSAGMVKFSSAGAVELFLEGGDMTTCGSIAVSLRKENGKENEKNENNW